MTRLRPFGATAGRLRGRAFGASAAHARLRLLLVVALGLLAARPAAAQTEIVEYYGHDALGSIRIVFTASGVATARADYEPFGEAVTIAGMPAGPLPAQQFTGQERDALERQDYFGARYYRPRHGRFSQVDPVYAGLFDPQQWNRYAYARNNPLSFVDPDGLATREATSSSSSCAAIMAVNKNDTPCFWAGVGSQAPGLSPHAVAFLNGGDNFNQFAGQASQELRQGPTKQAGGRDGSNRQAPAPPPASDDDTGSTKEDVAIVVPGVIGWKTGVPELHTSQKAMERAGTVMTGAVVLGYGAVFGRPKVVGPSRGYTSHGEGRIGGIIFGQGLLGFHLDIHPLRLGTDPTLHLNITSRGLFNVHVPIPQPLARLFGRRRQ